MSPPSSVERTRALVSSVAAFGLAGSGHQLPGAPLAPDEWRDLLTAARRHRVVGLLAAAIEAGAAPAEENQREQTLAAHVESMEVCLRLEAHLLSTAEVLHAAGVDVRVLKGPATAHLDYPDPNHRSFGDIDLLVPSAQFDDAAAALVGAGHRRRYREVRPGFDRRFGKGVCLESAGGREIDLHRTFTMGPYGLSVDLDDLWAAAAHFELAGRPFVALGAEQRFLHACYHAALGRATPDLVPLRDVAQLVVGAAHPLDLELVLELARRWQGEAVVARAVRLTWEEFDLEACDLSRWAKQHRTDRRDEQALRTYLDPTLGYAARQFAALRRLPGVRDKVTFAWALLAPDRSYGAGRHGGRWRRWWRAARQIVRIRRTSSAGTPGERGRRATARRRA